jgi:hypothetical protein
MGHEEYAPRRVPTFLTGEDGRSRRAPVDLDEVKSSAPGLRALEQQLSEQAAYSSHVSNLIPAPTRLQAVAELVSDLRWSELEELASGVGGESAKLVAWAKANVRPS